MVNLAYLIARDIARVNVTVTARATLVARSTHSGQIYDFPLSRLIFLSLVNRSITVFKSLNL